tara:strand:+ start:144 stop:467 length:324 start_codon:yes stop_codon:yes gene_type:complete
VQSAGHDLASLFLQQSFVQSVAHDDTSFFEQELLVQLLEHADLPKLISIAQDCKTKVSIRKAVNNDILLIIFNFLYYFYYSDKTILTNTTISNILRMPSEFTSESSE